MAGRRRLKRLAAAVLFAALLLCLSPAAHAAVEQSESFYAADYANVLREDTESWLCQVNARLEEQCQGAQIVVVTVDYLGGKTSDVYARELFYDWGVGSGDYDNGALLLLAVQENKAWLEYGLGIGSWLGGGQVDQLLEDTFWEPFDQGEYDEAVTALVSALLERYDGAYGSSVASGGQDASLPQTPAGNTVTTQRRTPFMGFNLIAALVVVIIVVALISGGVRRRRVYRPYRNTWRQAPPPPPPPGGFPPPMGPAPRRSAPPPGGAFRGGSVPRSPRPSRPPSSPRPGGGFRGGGGMGRGGGGRPGGGGGRR